MKSEKVIVSESGRQHEAALESESKLDFYMDKSDLEGRVIMYILIAIVALGFISMVAMGIFAFVM